MAIDRGNGTTTQLLTLLNVSATRAGKRKWLLDDMQPSQKLNKRRATVKFGDSAPEHSPETVEEKGSKDTEGENTIHDEDVAGEDQEEELEAEEDKPVEDGTTDSYEQHYGPTSAVLTDAKRDTVEKHSWKISKGKYGRIGPVVEYLPDIEPLPSTPQSSTLLERLKTPFQERQTRLPKELAALQNDMLSLLLSYRDLYITRTSLDSQQAMRETIALHALNHITKKRRRVLKNNERIAHATKTGAPVPEDVQDQGFTRPAVLILLPFRSFALRWISALTSHTPPPAFQVENQSRFQTEYGLPPGTTDRLATADPGTYPRDHVEMFQGNVDDNFRLGVKMTRKSVKLFAEFYGCDLILASPLGLRMSIEKEKNADFLSSIEMLIVDQTDALTMQNWEHIQFVLSHLNKLPKESHDVDFSRIKPWYLDGHAAFLRQTILLSAYETPETRSLFNQSLLNVAGKVRSERRWSPIAVPDGIDQSFSQFDCVSPQDEADKRFQHFTSQVLPAIMKSAVQSVNTVIFIPSSFDFIRVHNHFRKITGASFAVLSEYSSNQEISRARQAFFSGKKSFLLVSERFHFFRRYKIRGIRNIVFYAPPDHPQFYTEYLSYPFLDSGVEPTDVTCRVIYSRYDYMRLERIAGTEGAAALIQRGYL